VHVILSSMEGPTKHALPLQYLFGGNLRANKLEQMHESDIFKTFEPHGLVSFVDDHLFESIMDTTFT
jgi:hypothetical protein